MKKIIASALMIGAFQTGAAENKNSLVHPNSIAPKQVSLTENISRTQEQVEKIIHAGTSPLVFWKNLGVAGICDIQKNPYKNRSRIDLLQQKTDAMGSMQDCLFWESVPWKDLLCEITHVKSLEKDMLEYFITTEQQRIKDCQWENTEKSKLLQAIHQDITQYFSAKKEDQETYRIQLSEKLLSYVHFLNAADIAEIPGYGFMLEYLGFWSQVTLKTSKKEQTESEGRLKSGLYHMWEYLHTLHTWSTYIYEKKFPISVQNEYSKVLAWLWTFRDSPAEMEIYKSALEALHTKYGTSFSDMLLFAKQKETKKKSKTV
jgi:hypothetical protein